MRDKERRFLLEGATVVGEAAAKGGRLEEVFLTPSLVGEVVLPEGVALREVSEDVMETIATTETPQGVVAVAPFCDRPAAELLEAPGSLTVVLAGVRDPGNAGTILRTAWAAGVDAVFAADGTVDIYNPKVVRASAGALFHVPFARNVDVAWTLRRLGDAGVKRIAADPHVARSYHELDMTERLAFVFGNEAWGVPEELMSEVDERASIPMKGSAESLNVAIAAALFLFEARRQRG